MTDEFDENLDETFQEPKRKFWQRSSRKRTKSDVISVSSMDISLDSTIMKRKKRKTLTEFASNLLSGSTSGNRLSNALQRSFGFQANTTISIIDETDADSGPSHRTRSKCERVGNLKIHSWATDIASYSSDSMKKNLSRTDVQRQEAIYELYCGENVLLNDLQVLKEYYYEPIQSTDIFNQSELRTIFGDLDMLIHVHTKLRDDLAELRDSAGFTSMIGPTLLEWLPTLTEPYVERCRSQIMARHLLETKRARSKKFQEFLKSKTESSHTIDLWTYLDVARSRIVKYPLLINEILRRTSSTHEDHAMLAEVSLMFSKLLKKIDRAMGDAECELAQSKIMIKAEYDSEGCIKAATELITEGQMKDSRGLKLYCFLFDTCLALTRRVVKSRSKSYNLTHSVIPKDQLQIDTDCDDVYGIKIANHLLFVKDEHDKRHWVDAFDKANKITNIKIMNNENSSDVDKKLEDDELPIPKVLREKHFPIKRTARERPI
ncbi:hypothetical protein PV326_011383 [Microctonus aethiopoides]|nr:hypothetical protein PV326_011383 [Microctonus aethiopoides]